MFGRLAVNLRNSLLYKSSFRGVMDVESMNFCSMSPAGRQIDEHVELSSSFAVYTTFAQLLSARIVSK